MIINKKKWKREFEKKNNVYDDVNTIWSKKISMINESKKTISEKDIEICKNILPIKNINDIIINFEKDLENKWNEEIINIILKTKFKNINLLIKWIINNDKLIK